MPTSPDLSTKSDQTPSSLVEMPATRNGVQNQHSVIGGSISIKGTITASDPVYIYGCVEGSIEAPSHRVTVGREGKVVANISAREVVVMGEVCGNLNGGERVEIRGEGSLIGDLVTHRIYVEDGATLNGSIEVQKPTKAENPKHHNAEVAEPRAPQAATASDVERERWANLAVSEIA